MSALAGIIGASRARGGGATLGSSWKTATNATTTRNNFTGWLGGSFLVGASPITVNGLARWKLTGNTSTRTVKITDTSGTLVASVNIDLSAHSAGDWAAELISPVVLSASTRYIIQSYETSGADTWFESHSPSVTSVAGSIFSHYPTSSAATYSNVQYVGGAFYVGLNFYYTSP